IDATGLSKNKKVEGEPALKELVKTEAKKRAEGLRSLEKKKKKLEKSSKQKLKNAYLKGKKAKGKFPITEIVEKLTAAKTNLKEDIQTAKATIDGEKVKITEHNEFIETQNKEILEIVELIKKQETAKAQALHENQYADVSGFDGEIDQAKDDIKALKDKKTYARKLITGFEEEIDKAKTVLKKAKKNLAFTRKELKKANRELKKYNKKVDKIDKKIKKLGEVKDSKDGVVAQLKAHADLLDGIRKEQLAKKRPAGYATPVRYEEGTAYAKTFAKYEFKKDSIDARVDELSDASDSSDLEETLAKIAEKKSSKKKSKKDESDSDTSGSEKSGSETSGSEKSGSSSSSSEESSGSDVEKTKKKKKKKDSSSESSSSSSSEDEKKTKKKKSKGKGEDSSVTDSEGAENSSSSSSSSEDDKKTHRRTFILKDPRDKKKLAASDEE
ncbi:MAG: hypothetical protein ACM3JI_05690, partial [Anaerolineae bacterium]